MKLLVQMYACGVGACHYICYHMYVCMCLQISNTKKGEDPRLPVDLNQKTQEAFWAEIGSMPKVLNPHRLPDSDSRLQSGKQMSAKHE